MPVRIRIARRFWTRPLARYLLLACLGLFLLGVGAFAYAWHHFALVIDARLSGEIFERTSRIYAAPEMLSVGDALTREALVAQLRRFGYSDPDQEPTPYGRFRLVGSGLEIRPGPASRVGPGEAVRVEIAEGRVTGILSLRDPSPRSSAWLDPPLLTNLFDRNRTKRRLVRYEDLPPHLIQAVIAAEDRRFFNHQGISFLDGLRALWFDIGIWVGARKGARPQGASTVTMQLARSFFLNRDLSWKRKAAEAMIALQLERRFSKEKIVELYANEVYLGQRGSFSIHGFGEGAQAYFDKDIARLSVSESAFLAGLIRGPNRYNPYRHPERAVERRNYILEAMEEIGALSPAQVEAAKKEPLVPAAANVEASEAPYFVDLVKDELLERYPEEALISQSYRINTSLDRRLQQAAAEAVREAMPEVDAKVRERYPRPRRGPPVPEVQVALVALEPHSGEVKALVGGRDYTRSQLNHAVALRQPGSAFKPFVYAAAFSTALESPQRALTPVTTVVDEPTVFEFDGKPYEPSNFGEKFYGVVTLRDALIHSLNVATVKVAEMTGYERVAQLAQSAGLNSAATPAVALGAYDATPLQVAGAYTVFPNGGNHVEPVLISSVYTSEGQLLERTVGQPRPVLDPRVAYLVVDLMEDTLNRGTAAGVRARGFSVPAAGKTGTSRDGWFVGFTSNLLCAVWVGFDDGRDLGLPGAVAALPIWTAFMKRAVSLAPHNAAEDFLPPEGIVSVPLDPETLLLATPECPQVRTERFIVGTEPREFCPKHRLNVMQRVTRALSGALGIRRTPPREPPELPSAPVPAGIDESTAAPPPAPHAEEPAPPSGGLRGHAAMLSGSDRKPTMKNPSPLQPAKKKSSPPSSRE